MSDREYCRDCTYCEEHKYRPLGYPSEPKSYFMCEYPVPDWALPNVIVDPNQARTCNVQKLKSQETNTKMGP